MPKFVPSFPLIMPVNDIDKVSDLTHFIQTQFGCLETSEVEHHVCLARFDYQASYLPDSPLIQLIALYRLSKDTANSMAFLVTDKVAETVALYEQQQSAEIIAKQLNIAWIQLSQGLLLEPIKIAKPWGQEIWFTGMEARGVAKVQSQQGSSPLDWVLAAAPQQIMATSTEVNLSAPILLKILDPLPDEIYGDLYFEMHEEKQEVYVVTRVDEKAWPDGKGGIRFGFDQVIRQRYENDNAFKQAYLQAVEAYRSIRMNIDEHLDGKRELNNIDLDKAVSPETLELWQQSLSSEILIKENKLRHAMEAFIAIKPLKVGDVVKVPCFTPHSLQHGVTTVEFQTPVYERKILSFAQKVLTQDHWDTTEAMDKIICDSPEENSLLILEKSETLLREEVVNFSDFNVERIKLNSLASLSLDSNQYCLLLLLNGKIKVNDITYFAGQALLLPALITADIQATESSLLLLAKPSSHN